METFLVVTAGALWLLVSGGRDAAEHPALHSIAPSTKNLAQNISAEVENVEELM